MTVSFFPYRLAADGTWRCPLNHMDDLPNFANRNAADLLDDLGFDSSLAGLWEAEPVTIDLFEQAVVLARMGLDGKASPATEPRVVPGEGITVIHCGQRAGRANERLEQLLEMVKSGRAAGATHIGWG